MSLKGLSMKIHSLLSVWSGLALASVLLFATQSASAQVLLAGEWVPLTHEDQTERGPGPDLGDYLGIPINNAARLRAESWDASRLTLPEQQCRVHISPYIYRGPMAVRIWEEKDPDNQRVVAIRNYISTYEQNRTIWMDDRPHPPAYAPHTWMGFSTGKWEGGILTVYTTHLKMGWLRRNGLPESDQATMIEHFIRHGNYMSHVSIVTDPVYLAEPLIKSTDFVLNLNQNINWLWPCESVLEVVDRPKGKVPNYLPGQNAFLKEFTTRTHVPDAAAMGGPETTYPEYRANMKFSSHDAPLMHPSGPPRSKLDGKGKVEVYPVQNGVYLVTGGGANITAQVGSQGILLVDSGAASASPQVVAALRTLAPQNSVNKQVRYIIDTSVDEDHAGGNENVARANGVVSSAVALVNTPGSTAMDLVQVLAQENVLTRMSAAIGSAAISQDGWPTEAFFEPVKDMYFNGEAVRIYHIPNAHTDGDSIVHFRRADIVSTGDIYVADSYPVIDLAKGGSLQGIIDGLNLVLDIAVPAHHEEGGTMVIPGHGRISDEADVVEYRDMLTIFRDRIQDSIKKGMTLEQVKASRPTLDYDPEFGATSGPWTIDMFVEAMYKSLTPSPKK
jgi:cyclase